MITVAEVLAATKTVYEIEDPSQEFSAVITDSRDVPAGSLFVALKGEKFDGHDYCQQAVEKGAAAVLTEREIGNLPSTVLQFVVADTLTAYQEIAKCYRRKFTKLRVVAITGSNGKTSTKDMIAACLSTCYNVVKTEGNYNNEIGVPKTLLSIDATTDIVVVEMGMRGLGQIKRLCMIAEPDIAVLTNVGETHMELLGSLENIALAKSEILAGLDKKQTAILNWDDYYIKQMTTKAQIISYGFVKDAVVRANEYSSSGFGTTFAYQSLNQAQPVLVYIPYLGKHNVYNALAAIATAEVFAIPKETIIDALKAVSLTAKRQEIRSCGNNIIINDAYNASPASMKAAIETLAELKRSAKEKKSIAVLADMLELGALAKNAHLQVAQELIVNDIDCVIAYGEETKVMVEYLVKAGRVAIHCANAVEAAGVLKEHLTSNGVILFKGSNSMAVDKVINLVFDNNGVGV
ncbi:MAG TPA: UDP-N-acetylmuramoyl-tripeptide--D-alanyl-D-alanine ligase [Candidatus Avacidaminococcus intestinavium]|uniref:UDP-N-acetylmuramoyl-tripeptide--D-alanyl-D-alanine ligase n=1 Tax=Candidatus Avacidaminococcus intestinavium TaxID=2840684 RepID=A0A9D1MP36_9FIRM|nr:UDP-N-acetylmuramoyl-tripeptide--D-alanyl-D-alanine ligase [Candidatus Avacidaminococcus intestinavium]